MDSAIADELRGSLHGLFSRVEDRLSATTAKFVHEFIDAGEFGLALETMAEMLGEDQRPVSSEERTEFIKLVTSMSMDDRVERSLALCPTRS